MENLGYSAKSGPLWICRLEKIMEINVASLHKLKLFKSFNSLTIYIHPKKVRNKIEYFLWKQLKCPSMHKWIEKMWHINIRIIQL